MNVRMMSAFAIAVLAAGSALAGGAAADPSQAVDMSGSVVAFTAASGSGMPMLTVEDTSLGVVDVGLGPLWTLQEAGFGAEVGDQVVLRAFACDVCAAPWVAAWVDNVSNGSSVDLRDDEGRPLWTQRGQARGGSGRPGQGQGGGTGSGSGGTGGGSGQPGGSGSGTGTGPGLPGGIGGLDMTQVQTVTGEVVDVDGAAGAGGATVDLEADGTVYEITVSPYQPVEASGLIIEPGLVLEMTFAPTVCDGEVHLIAIAITDVATGLVIQLRDPETGFPMAPGGGHNRPNWP